MLLHADNVRVRFGGVTAVDGASLQVSAGEFLGLIGPNGSGKTTLFNSITGDQKVSEGRIHFNGQDVTRWAKYKRARAGLARTYQNVQVFPDMLVTENLIFAAEARGQTPSPQRVRELVDFLSLAHLAHERAGNLSYGQKKLLSIGLAVISDPQILLLDEPMAAVNPVMVDLIAERLVALNKLGVTIVLVEHNLPIVLKHCSRVAVLNFGQIIFNGPATGVRADDGVAEAYLGKTYRQPAKMPS